MKEKGTFTTSEGTGGYNNKPLNQFKITMKTAVEYLVSKLFDSEVPLDEHIYNEIQQAKEIEKEQRGYSEEEVRLAYFQGEKDSYVKGGQTKEMENEFIQSLKQTKQQEQ
jgi:flagellar biosynthesis/type III secretory pathway protein FliH